jgi:DnaJ-class molecular chaperone
MSGKEPDLNSEDFYAILGLDQSATDDDIRRSYKRLALKYHPDKQGSKSDEEKKDAENKFKKVAEAYEILSDKKKRRIYDEGGLEAIRGGGSGTGSTGGSFHRGGGFDNHFTF